MPLLHINHEIKSKFQNKVIKTSLPKLSFSKNRKKQKQFQLQYFSKSSLLVLCGQGTRCRSLYKPTTLAFEILKLKIEITKIMRRASARLNRIFCKIK